VLQRLLPRPWFDRFERWWARRHGVFDYAPDSVLRLQLHPHAGPPVRLSDGTVVQPGDPVAEVHVDSARLARLHAELGDARKVGLQFARELTYAFAALARHLRDHPDLPAVAVFGNTLYWQGSERLGWEVRDLPPGLHTWLLQAWLHFLVWYYHPQGVRRISGRPRLARVRQIWISRSRLVALYADAERAGSVARPKDLLERGRLKPPRP
jgi:hypothetical protein